MLYFSCVTDNNGDREMKLYANTETLNQTQILKLVGLTKTMPKSDGVYTIYLDDNTAPKHRKLRAAQQLKKLTGRTIYVQGSKTMRGMRSFFID